MLIIENLTRSTRWRARLEDVDLASSKGFRPARPNGAGKSTLMRIVATLQTPTSVTSGSSRSTC